MKITKTQYEEGRKRYIENGNALGLTQLQNEYIAALEAELYEHSIVVTHHQEFVDPENLIVYAVSPNMDAFMAWENPDGTITSIDLSFTDPERAAAYTAYDRQNWVWGIAWKDWMVAGIINDDIRERVQRKLAGKIEKKEK